MLDFALRLLGKDLSIVIQGPITFRRFVWVALYYRIFAPLSEIIFSHYSLKIHSSFVTNIGIKSVYNAIPDNMKDIVINKERSDSISNNINLQILTTRAGLNEVTKSSVIKIRSDLLIIFPMFVIWLGSRHVGKIICLNYSIAPVKIMQFFPHVSDWFYYGSKDAIFHIFKRNYPVSFLDTGKHAIESISWYYKAKNYTDYMQAEEFLTLSFFCGPKARIVADIDINHSELLAGVKKYFVICFGPSLFLVHLGKKWNYWVPHSDRANIQELSSIGCCTFGGVVESVVRKLHSLYKYCKKYV